MNTMTRRSIAVAAALVATAGLAACGNDDSSDSAASAPADTAAAAAPTTAMAASDMVGSGCAAYAKQVPSGAGSVAGMAQDPVATAASNNPLLTTLVSAVSGKLNPKVDLVDTLNSGQFTVFAPIDAAFAKVPAKTLSTLKTDDKALSSVLTYHVIQGQLSPSQITGEHATVEGADVDVTGSGNDLKVNGANVICGGVKTANATVYLIDGVLTPPMKK